MITKAEMTPRCHKSFGTVRIMNHHHEERETKMEINELAEALNRSTGEWLNAWIKATGPLATEQDVTAFMSLAGDKRDMAHELVTKLAQGQLERYRAEKHTA
jgi:hypothetical protein